MIDFSTATAIPETADAVGVFALEGRLTDLPNVLTPEFTRTSGFSGKLKQLLQTADGDRLLVAAGLGAAPSIFELQHAAAELGRAFQHATHAAILVPGIDAAVRAIVTGVALGSYGFDSHRSEPHPSALQRVTLVGGAMASDDVAAAHTVAQAVNFARDLANETPARMTARHLADAARHVAAREHLECDVFDEVGLREGGFGCLLAVNAGSVEPPRLIELRYEPPVCDETTPQVVIVGKGITFDSGGLSLKRPEHMYDMKGDMGGAAAVIAVMGVLRALGVAVRVTGIVAATDNMPGPTATRPGEVVHARNGKTVEILDTDAEGRLVLADALAYAAERAPSAIVDIATLTGCRRTLGTSYTIVHSNDEMLRDRLLAASRAAGELTWPFPAPRHYRDYLDSNVADLRNIGDPDDFADPILAALFLNEFTGGAPWVHLDIGETGWAAKTEGEQVKGCTGAMVRTLCELLRDWPH